MTNPVITGSLESSDCLITLYESEPQVIEVDTVVHDAFHAHILTLIKDVLKSHAVDHMSVRVQDKGALDYAIKARLIAAIERYKDDSNG
jgi:citrate lyase subunit gamma (acyl carrier protein)